MFSAYVSDVSLRMTTRTIFDHTIIVSHKLSCNISFFVCYTYIIYIVDKTRKFHIVCYIMLLKLFV